MNPWNGAEAESAEEAKERDLFARRARVLGQGEVASLASVLRAVRLNRDVPEALGADKWGPAARGARARTIVAMSLAAACMTAAVTRLPRTRTSGANAVDIDASPPHATIAPEPAPVRVAGVQSPASAVSFSAACSSNDEVLVSEEAACSTPAPAFFTSTSSAAFSAGPARGSSMTIFAPRQTLLDSPTTLACEASE